VDGRAKQAYLERVDVEALVKAVMDEISKVSTTSGLISTRGEV